MTHRGKTLVAGIAVTCLVAAFALALRARRTSHYRVRFGDASERLSAVKELADKPPRWAVRSLLTALDRRAKAEHRSRSAMVELLLAAALGLTPSK